MKDLNEALNVRARGTATEVYRDTPNLPKHTLRDTAYDVLWHGDIYKLGEEDGYDADDRTVQSTYMDTFCETYEALRAAAGPDPTWRSEVLISTRRELVDLGVARSRIRNVDAFFAASSLDHAPANEQRGWCDLVRYTHGLLPSAPTRLRTSNDDWTALFAELPGWGEVEIRLCTWVWSLAKSKRKTAKLEVYRLFTTALHKGLEGDADFTAVVRQTVLAAGESESAFQSACIEDIWAGIVSTDSQPYSALPVTSLGRWLCNEPFAAVFPVARKKMRVPHYARVLLHVSPDTFATHFADFETPAIATPGWRVSLTESMLRTDPARFEAPPLRWLEDIEAPELRASILIYIVFAFGPKHRDLVLQHTASVIQELGPRDSYASDAMRADPELAVYADFPNSSVKLCLIATVLREFGSEALPFVDAFETSHPGREIRFFEILARWAAGNRLTVRASRVGKGRLRPPLSMLEPRGDSKNDQAIPTGQPEE